jgi:transposase
MIDMLKRHEIQVLRRAGHTLAEVATLSGVSVGTVRRVVDETAVTTVDNDAERDRRQIGRPPKAEAYREVLLAALADDATLRTVELLHRARLAGYTGGKSALYALAHTLRGRVVTPLVRFEGLAGEFSQHDFGEVEVRYQNGPAEKVHFFASRLKYSRWAEVTLVPDQRVETLVRTLVDHLAAFGGIPLVAVFDRPKRVALKWGRDGVVTEWNPTFAGVALDLGLGVEVCWPYRAQEKGAVENLVGWVKGSFFKQRRFLDREDLERQLHEWLVETNTVRPSRATGVPPAMRIAEERASSSTTPTLTRCRRMRLACRGRSICTAIESASSRDASAPSTSGSGSRATGRFCPSIALRAWPLCRASGRGAISSASICSTSARPRWPSAPSISRTTLTRRGPCCRLIPRTGRRR